MKTMKKIFSLLMVVTIVLAMGVTAFAAETNSVKVTGAKKGATYNIYKMMDLSVNTTNEAYVYTVNSAWTNFFTNGGAGASYVDVDGQGYVTWKQDMNTADNMTAFAKAAETFAAANSTATAADAQTPQEDGDITFTGLDSGYYLVTSTLGLNAMVQTTPQTTEAVIAEKNSAPTVDKQVQEDSNGNWGDKNDAEIGETVNFKTIITVGEGIQNYILHDTMSAGLNFAAVKSVTAYDTDGTTVINALAETTGYTVNTTPDDKHTFDISFVQDIVGSLNAGQKIVVEYTAKVNDAAVIRDAGNTNETYLSYGENSSLSTVPDTTTTYVWDFDILKYTMKNNTETYLEGAKFKLYYETGEGVNATKHYAVITNGKLTGWTDTEANGTELISDAQGKIMVDGLDSGDYFIVETEAPVGYNKLADPIKFTIAGAESIDPTIGTVSTYGNDGVTTTATENNTIKVENKTGSLLPSTGGIGTTIFYIAGGLLVVGAIVFFVVRKRMGAETPSENNE